METIGEDLFNKKLTMILETTLFQEAHVQPDLALSIDMILDHNFTRLYCAYHGLARKHLEKKD